MAKHQDLDDDPHVKRKRKPDPGLHTCHGCGGVITQEGELLVTPMGQPHDCASGVNLVARPVEASTHC